MKVLITGASGLLGRAMMRAFADCEVLGLGLTRADPAQRIVACDLLDAGAFQKVVEDFKPFVIIHCAAERRPEVCANKPEVAHALNVEYAYDTLFLHLSQFCPLFSALSTSLRLVEGLVSLLRG
jgi:dTDP-4-dehydrorhamnose reductase